MKIYIYILLISIFFWVLFFIVLYFVYNILKKNFCKHTLEIISDEEFVVIHKTKLEEKVYSCIIANKYTNKIYYNWTFLYYYSYSLNFYDFFLGKEKLEKYLYSYGDFAIVSARQYKNWNSFYDYIVNFLDENIIDEEYWINFFISLYLFIFIFAFYCKCPSFIDEGLYTTAFAIRISLIILVFFITLIFFIINKYNNKKDNNDVWTYNHKFIKLLVLLWGSFNELPKIINMMFCIYFNLSFLFIMSYFIGLSDEFSYTLATYALIVIFSALLNIIAIRFSNYFPNDKIVNFLASNRLKTILFFPAFTYILSYLFYFLWLFWLIVSVRTAGERKFLRLFLLFLVATKIFKLKIDDPTYTNYFAEIHVFLNKHYFFNYHKTLFKHFWGEDFCEESLKKREATKDLAMQRKLWYKL